MTLFSRIKKVLKDEDVCVVSKNKEPLYVVMKWDKYKKLIIELKELKENQKLIKDENVDYEIDINKIPV